MNEKNKQNGKKERDERVEREGVREKRVEEKLKVLYTSSRGEPSLTSFSAYFLR